MGQFNKLLLAIDNAHTVQLREYRKADMWNSTTLAPKPNKFTSNFDYSSRNRHIQVFTVETMKLSLGTGLEEESLLCPVRALPQYLYKSKDLNMRGNILFLQSWVQERYLPQHSIILDIK